MHARLPLWFVQYLLDHNGGRAVLCGSGQVTPTANEGTWESAWNRIVVEQSLIYGRLAKLCFHVRRDLLTEFLARIPFESF